MRARVGDALGLHERVAVAVCAGLVGYAAVRAHVLSFTFDESYTYTRYVGDSFISLLRYEQPTANHHLLNTLSMKAASALVGSSELALRFASVGACGLYFGAVLVFVRRLRAPALRWLTIAVAGLNPYVLDFFSLARGYAVGLACVAASSVAAAEFARRPAGRTAVISIAFAAVGTLASFALAGFFAAAALGVSLVALQARRAARMPDPSRAVLLAVVAAGGVLGLLAAEPVLRLRRLGELYAGGREGFWQDTAGSLVLGFLYEPRSRLVELAVVVVVAAVLLAAVLATVLSLRAPRAGIPPSAVLAVLIGIPAALSMIQHHVLDAPYLEGRTALFFVPLVALWAGAAADEGASRHDPRLKAGVLAGAVLVTAGAVVNFSATANVSSTYDWRYDADTEQIVRDLDRAGSARDGPLRVGASWLYEPTINFYRETRDLRSFDPVVTDCRVDCLAGAHDAFVVVATDLPDALGRGGHIVERYRTSGAILLLR